MSYFHGSDADCTFPSFDYIDNWTPDDGRAVKVVFGFYVTPDVRLAEGCGAHVYEIELKRGHREMTVPLRQFTELYRGVTNLADPAEQVREYIRYRTSIGEYFDIVHIEEHDGRIVESVILNLNAIASFKKRVR